MPPRPRPRPRPANRQAGDQAHKTASSIAQAVPLSKADRESELDKGDELFLRNRNRTAKDWKRLDLLEKEKGESSKVFDALRKIDVYSRTGWSVLRQKFRR